MKSRGASPINATALWIAWLILEVAVAAVALASSARKPITDQEKQTPAGPFGQVSGAYLERLFVLPRFRWDAQHHFVAITTQGYFANSSTLAFYPLYPLSARLLYLAGLSPHLSLLLLSTLGALAFLFMFRRLAGLDLDERESLWAALVLLVFPMSLILYLP
jgi:hypothetical protein